MTDSLSVADTLRAARDYIAEHGWTQGALRTRSGAACAVGAIHAAGEYPTIHLAIAAVKDAIQIEWLTNWNDQPGRTQAEVEKGLLLAADRVEFGGDR